MNIQQGTRQVEQAVIRPLKAEDTNDIYNVYRSLVGEERAGIDTDMLCADISGALDLSYVVERNGEVVGFIIARHTYIGEPPVEAGLIHGLGIHPLHQGQGLASRLLTTVAEKAGSTGIRNLRVMLNERDSRLESFFQSKNFRRARLAVYDMDV